MIQRTAGVTGDLIVDKTADKLQQPQKPHQKIIQKRMKKKLLIRGKLKEEK